MNKWINGCCPFYLCSHELNVADDYAVLCQLCTITCACVCACVCHTTILLEMLKLADTQDSTIVECRDVVTHLYLSSV